MLVKKGNQHGRKARQHPEHYGRIFEHPSDEEVARGTAGAIGGEGTA